MKKRSKRSLLPIFAIISVLSLIAFNFYALAVFAEDGGGLADTYTGSDSSEADPSDQVDSGTLPSTDDIGTSGSSSQEDNPDTTLPPSGDTYSDTLSDAAKDTSPSTESEDTASDPQTETVTTTIAPAVTTTVLTTTTAKAATTTTWHIIRDGSVSGTAPRLSPTTPDDIAADGTDAEADDETPTLTVSTGTVTTANGSTVTSTTSVTPGSPGTGDKNATASFISARGIAVTGAVLSLAAVAAIALTIVFTKKEA